jgi:hypothetical protein
MAAGSPTLFSTASGVIGLVAGPSRTAPASRVGLPVRRRTPPLPSFPTSTGSSPLRRSQPEESVSRSGLPSPACAGVLQPYLAAGFRSRVAPPPPFLTTLAACSSSDPVACFGHSRPWGSFPLLPRWLRPVRPGLAAGPSDHGGWAPEPLVPGSTPHRAPHGFLPPLPSAHRSEPPCTASSTAARTLPRSGRRSEFPASLPAGCPSARSAFCSVFRPPRRRVPPTAWTAALLPFPPKRSGPPARRLASRSPAPGSPLRWPKPTLRLPLPSTVRVRLRWSPASLRQRSVGDRAFPRRPLRVAPFQLPRRRRRGPSASAPFQGVPQLLSRPCPRFPASALGSHQGAGPRRPARVPGQRISRPPDRFRLPASPPPLRLVPPKSWGRARGRPPATRTRCNL